MGKRKATKNKESEDKPIPLAKKKKKHFWITATIASQIGREELLAATFKEIILHLISLTILSIYIFSQINSSEYYVTNAMKTAFQTEEKLQEIVSASDVWEYLMGPVMEAFYGQDDLEDYLNARKILVTNITNPLTSTGKASVNGTKKASPSFLKRDETFIANENMLLGVPRIRQVKVTNNSCEIHGYFRRLFYACYNKFSNRWEDREEFGPQNSTAWEYSISSKTRSHIYWGTLTVYSGGGFYTDLGEDLDKTMIILEELKDKLWVTRGTRAVFVDFSVYNANLNLFCINKLIFEFLPSGGVRSSFKFTPATLIPFSNAGQWVLRILLYLFGLYALYCLCEEVREITYFKGRYFGQFWNYVDYIVIMLTCVLIVGTEYLRFTIKSYLDEIRKSPDQYGNLETPCFIYTFVRISGASVLFFLYLRTFKYLNFNRRMAQLNNTIKKCSKDILGFSVMFFVAYFAYAELGYLVFGSQVYGFRGFGVAMFTLLRTILGDFDYGEIHDANWLVAPIYFLSYIMLVFFILLNMFLAIINDTYADVKTDIALAPKEMEMTEYIGRGFNNFLRKLGFTVREKDVTEKHLNTSISRIRDALVKCDFEDREIQMYFTRYDIDPLKSLTEQEVERFFEKFAQEDRARIALQENVVTWKDFQKQDDKLVELENSLVILGQRVHDLLRTIENIQGR